MNHQEPRGDRSEVFSSPEPIQVELLVYQGTVEVAAASREDTVVEVRPSDPARQSDVEAASATSVAFESGRLAVTAPEPSGDPTERESIAVTIGLPEGSDLRACLAAARLRARGALHGVDVSAAAGNVSLDQVDGTGTVRSASGSVRITAARGRVEVRAASGAVEIGSVGAGARVETASGAVRVGEVCAGEIDIETKAGAVEVGVPDGVAAWLDLDSAAGPVRNDLDDAAGPGSASETVAITVSTKSGAIRVRRA